MVAVVGMVQSEVGIERCEEAVDKAQMKHKQLALVLDERQV